MDLNEVITHEREEAKEYRKTADGWYAGGCSYAQAEGNVCLECAKEHEQLAEWLTELAERRKTEPIVYEVTENFQGFIVETNDDRNIGLKKVSTSNLIYAMREITEKYWDEGLRVVFKYYCGNGDEWQKIYESEAEND